MSFMEKLDVPQGTLDLLILTVVRREALHGYGLSQRLSALTHETFHLNPGSLFPALYRLERDGHLKSDWRTTENNRKAKYYSITSSGRKQLDKHHERWKRVALAITNVLEGA